jgi:predicted amidohydrolase
MVYPGASAIIDPWGEVLAEGGSDEEILITTINLPTIEDVRSRIPCFQDRIDPAKLG